jgi:hypothetical protein
MNRGRTARLLVLAGTVLLFATCSRQKTGSELSQQGSSRPSSPAVDIATRQENNLVVVTEDASLLEALKDANIKWTAPVNFGAVARAPTKSCDV